MLLGEGRDTIRSALKIEQHFIPAGRCGTGKAWISILLHKRTGCSITAGHHMKLGTPVALRLQQLVGTGTVEVENTTPRGFAKPGKFPRRRERRRGIIAPAEGGGIAHNKQPSTGG